MTRSSHGFALLCAWLSSLSAAPASADPSGHVSCAISENGEAATGVLSVVKNGQEVATGSCGREIAVPVGNYVASLRLDGALDGPEQHQPISVKSGANLKVSADFATATLQVRITSAGRRAAGMAIIKRNGQQLGTLGSGVGAHLSAGTYRVFVRYRQQEKDLGEHTLAAGDQLVLDATFE